MLKKIFLTFTFLTLLTTFFGLNKEFDLPDGTPCDAASSLPGVTATAMAAGTAAKPVISDYDELFRLVAREEGYDWRLMSAMAYHESRFTPDIVSRRGAAGLMQIMPATARQFNVAHEQVLDPETNIRLASLLLARIEESLHFAPDTPERDRLSIILASYNGGIGHVNDARRLARSYGENPDSWEVVARYLTLKAQPEYYNNEAVRCGRFTGGRQTLAYVRDVMTCYARYCRIAVL